jgi:hypothetical protein
MEAVIDLVCYLYHIQDLFVQYTRAPNGNNPHVYEKGWSHRKFIEERLRATKPGAVPTVYRQKSTLMPITRGTTLPDEVLQVC